MGNVSQINWHFTSVDQRCRVKNGYSLPSSQWPAGSSLWNGTCCRDSTHGIMYQKTCICSNTITVTIQCTLHDPITFRLVFLIFSYLKADVFQFHLHFSTYVFMFSSCGIIYLSCPAFGLAVHYKLYIPSMLKMSFGTYCF